MIHRRGESLHRGANWPNAVPTGGRTAGLHRRTVVFVPKYHLHWKNMKVQRPPTWFGRRKTRRTALRRNPVPEYVVRWIAATVKDHAAKLSARPRSLLVKCFARKSPVNLESSRTNREALRKNLAGSDNVCRIVFRAEALQVNSAPQRCRINGLQRS